MANRFLNNITINDQYTLPSSDGTDGQILSTTGAADGTTELEFIDQGSLAAGSAESTHILVKNTSGAQIAKGTPVYVTGETGNSGKIEIAPADAADETKMPALGLLETTLNDNAEGYCVQGGLLEALATATIDGTSTTANDTVYIKSGGGLTMTKPTGSNFIQNIAKVARVHASNGSLVVSSILRTNDVPTPLYIDHANQRLGIGITSPQTTLHMGVQAANPTRTEEFRLESRGSSGFGGNSVVNLYTGTYGLSGIYFGDNAAYSYQPARVEFIDVGNTLNYDSTQYHNWKVLGSTKMTLKNNFLGIGITNPLVPLHISSTAVDTDFLIACGNTQARMSINNTSTGDSQINFQLSNSSKFAIGVDNSDGDKFKISGSSALGSNDRIVVDSSGNVGIGTTNPDTKLEINGTGHDANFTSGCLKIEDPDGTSMFIDANDIDCATGILFLQDYSLNPVRFGGNLQIPNGLVGIGMTTTPSQKLHVVGNARVTGAYYDSTNSPGTSGQVLSSTASGTDWIDGTAIPGVPDGSGTAGKIVMWQDSDTLTDSKITQTAGSETNYVDIDFANVEDLTITGDSSFSTFTVYGFDAVNFSNIENNFNVGNGDLAISTADSSMSLGTTTADSDTLTAGYTTTRFIGTGNFGIGTTSPSKTLEVEGSVQNYMPSANTDFSIVADDGFDVYLGFGTKADRLKGYIRKDLANDSMSIFSAGNLRLGTADTEKMRIDHSGNVGINTTNPNQKLTIRGNDNYVATEQTNYAWGGTNTIGVRIGTSAAGLLDFRRWDGGVTHGTAVITQVSSDGGWGLDFRVDNKSTNTSATNSRMFLSTSGEVGIGTRSPSEKLHVYNGSAYITPIAYAANQNDWVIRTGAYNNTSFDQGLKIKSTSGGVSYMAFETAHGGGETMVLRSGKVGIGTTSPGEKLTLQTQATGLGSEGVFIKNPFAGSTPIVNSKSPFLSLATSNSSGYTSTIYMGRNGTATGQESKIEWSNSNNGLSIYVAGQGSYREHVRFGNLSSSVARTYFNGNVGIGTTSPAYLLDVNEDDNVLAFRVTGGGGGAPIASFVRDVGATGSSVNINAQSNFPQIQFTNTSNTFSIGGDTSGNFKISDNTAIGTNDRITIDNTGNVGIGQTNPSTYKLDVSGTIRATGDVIAYSDIRVKENIKSINNALDKVKKLRGVEYNKIDNTEKSIGVIAQEIEEVIPEVVREDDQGMKSVAYGNITAVLIEAIKEQQNQIDELKNQLNAFTK